MVTNSQINLYARVGETENGKVVYQNLNVRPGEKPISVKVDKKNADTFEKLNTDIVMSSAEAAKKQSRSGFIGAGVLGLGTFLGTVALFKKHNIVGALLALITGAIGGVGGFLGGNLVSNKMIMPKYLQRIQQDAILMNKLIEK